LPETCPTGGRPGWNKPAHRPAFSANVAVAWSTTLAPMFAPGAIIRQSYLSSQDPNVKFGVTIEEQEPNMWSVLLDGDTDPRTFTADELVRYE